MCRKASHLSIHSSSSVTMSNLYSVIIFAMFVLISKYIQCTPIVSHDEDELGLGGFADRGEFPHQILMTIIFRNNNGTVKEVRICGGSILSETHIILAAHCVHCIKPSRIAIHVGVHELREAMSRRVDVIKAIVHPCYNPNDLLNDIAILVLKRPLSFNSFVSPIMIDENNMALPGIKGTTIGWGYTNRDDNQSFAKVLKKAHVEIVQKECREIISTVAGRKNYTNLPDYPDVESQICVFNEVEFICLGDSGGPLLCDSGTGPNILCGVVSLALTEDPDEICLGPSVFIRVYHYRHWIKAIMEEEDYDSAEGCIGRPYHSECPSPIEFIESTSSTVVNSKSQFTSIQYMSTIYLCIVPAILNL